MKTGFLLAMVLLCRMCVNDNSTSSSTSTDTISDELITKETITPVEETVVAMEDENVLYSKEERISKTVDNYQIVYRIIYTGKVFLSNDTTYADKDIVLTIKKGSTYILNEKRFNRTDFASIISPLVMDEIWLHHGRILEICPEYVIISVSASIPETDMLYNIRLTVHNDGKVEVSGEEVLMEDDSFANAASSLSGKKNIVHNDTIQCDTIIGNFHISYVLEDNRNVIKTQSVTDNGSIITEYADRSVFLWIMQNNREVILSNKEINKHTFTSIISPDEIGKYQLWNFGIEKVEEDKVSFRVNICVPDTDICYFIELCVSKDGNIAMSEIEQI